MNFTNLWSLKLTVVWQHLVLVSHARWVESTCKIRGLQELELFVPCIFKNLFILDEIERKSEIIEVFNHLCARMLRHARDYRKLHDVTTKEGTG